ncbi:MAG: rod shape-determining protein MreD [Nitrosomonas sp.]|nr:MAG: rod shape-determining protein MreD [Nitrosomonas sp.]
MTQDVYVPANNWVIAVSLVAALILNLMPLQGDFLVLRPDFVAIALAYWNVNHPYKIGMLIAFFLGLMMDVGDAGILGQHALAYCVIVYLTSVFGRRLRLFNAVRQAPQIGLILFMMQTVMVLIAISTGSPSPEWHYFLATVTGALLWVPASVMLTTLQKPKADPDVL